MELYFNDCKMNKIINKGLQDRQFRGKNQNNNIELHYSKKTRKKNIWKSLKLIFSIFFIFKTIKNEKVCLQLEKYTSKKNWIYLCYKQLFRSSGRILGHRPGVHLSVCASDLF